MWAQSTSLPDIDEEHWSLSRWNATFHFQKERNTITLYLLFRQWSSLHGSLLNVFLLLLVCMKNFQKSLVDVRLPLESVLNKDYHHNINCTCWVTLQFPCYHALITIDWLIDLHIQCRPEQKEQCKRKTDAMDASGWTRVRVRADEHLRQLGRIGQERIFLVLFIVTALLCGALL